MRNVVYVVSYIGTFSSDIDGYFDRMTHVCRWLRDNFYSLSERRGVSSSVHLGNILKDNDYAIFFDEDGRKVGFITKVEKLKYWDK